MRSPLLLAGPRRVHLMSSVALPRVAAHSSAVLSALSSAVLSAGCADWPHFDYEDTTPVQVIEQESTSGEAAQSLSRLYGDAEVLGQISSSEYRAAVGWEAPFGLPGWYAGDMDWFQFGIWERRDLLTLTLTWEASEALLDLYFFVSDAEGKLQLIDWRAGEVMEGTGIAFLQVENVNGQDLYAFAVAGRQGTAIDWQLQLTLGNLETP